MLLIFGWFLKEREVELELNSSPKIRMMDESSRLQKV